MIGPFSPPKRRGQLAGIPRPVEIEAQKARAGDARGDAAHIGADPRIAPGAGGEAVGFAVGHGGTA